MSLAWEGADRLMGGSGNLSERFAQELSEPITQRILPENDLATFGSMQHAELSSWPEGDLIATNVITAIMQASLLRMACPLKEELPAAITGKPCSLHGTVQQSAIWKFMSGTPLMHIWRLRQSSSCAGDCVRDCVIHEMRSTAHQTSHSLPLTPE